MLIVILISTK